MRQTSLAKVGRRLHKAGPLSDAVVVVGGGGGQGVAVSRGGCHLEGCIFIGERICFMVSFVGKRIEGGNNILKRREERKGKKKKRD